MLKTRTLDELLSAKTGPVLIAEALNALPGLREMYPDYKLLLTGSVLYNGHGADMDVLINAPFGFTTHLARDGWEGPSTDYPDPEEGFVAMRRGLVNFIVVCDEEDYAKWCTAGALCWDYARRNGGIDKETRVSIHHTVRNVGAPSRDQLEYTNIREIQRASTSTT